MFSFAFPLPRLTVVVLLAASLCAVSDVPAETPFQKQLARIHAANQAMRNLAEARLELQIHLLGQMDSLYKGGHASWLELARQQLIVDQLKVQLEAFDQFEQFVASLEHHQQSSGVWQTRHIDAPPPLKLYDPNSQRLIGWIEPDVLDEHSVAGPLPDEGVALREAREKFEKAQKKLAAVKKATSAPEHWLEQTQLHLNVAAAELELAVLQDREQATEALVNTPDPDVPDDEFLTAVQQTGLKHLTWRVASVEAAATGVLRQAEVELQRLQRRVNAIEKLFEKGFASEGERKQSQQQLQEAQQVVEAEKLRLQQLQSLCATFANDEFNNPGVTDVNIDTSCDWPEFILQDAHRLDHLIDLRRRYFGLLGQQAAAQARLEMWQTWTHKVRDAVAATAGETAHAEVSRLSRSLDEGQRREVQKLELEMEAIKATILDFGEKRNVLALEEQRFIEQCQAQDHLRTASMVSTSAASAKVEKLFPRFSYLESLDFRSRADMLSYTWYRPGHFNFGFIDRPVSLPYLHSTYRSSMAHYPYGLSSALPYKWYRPRRFDMSYLDSELSLRRYCHRSRFSHLRTRTCQRNFSALTSYRYYQYGSLRPEYWNCAPVGQVPWYFPGSPGNYRGW